jgi:hypothetical protein
MLREPQTIYSADFAPALLNPTAAVPEIVTGPSGKGATKRFNVYRNNVTVSLIDALAAIYPAVQRITGSEFFRAMARFHVRETPPNSPLLFDYGRDFPNFIASYEHAQSLPWLADVARIERAWLDAYHARDAAPLSPAALASIASDDIADLTFTAHPATRVVRSEFSAVTTFAANRGDPPIEHRIDASTPEDALVVRPAYDVEVRRLPPGGATFAIGLLSGRTLGEAAALAAEEPEFDLAVNIAGLIDAGAFASLRSGDAR